MADWKTDAELFTLMKNELFTAVVGDVMDVMGLITQFLPPDIHPLRDDMVVAGRAMTVLEADCAGTVVASENRNAPFGLMFEALDSLMEHEVYLCTGGSHSYARWGELMSTRAVMLGAAGAVLDGYSRDTRGTLATGLPVFSTGRYAQDQGVRGRVIDYRCPLRFPNGLTVRPGDIVFGDLDGVVVIPRQREAEIVEAAIEKVRGENRVRTAILGGTSTVEAFRKFGIM